jgi:glycine hydroxymethyltransferase
VDDERLLGVITELHAANHYAYGSRRMWKALLRAGERVGRSSVSSTGLLERGFDLVSGGTDNNLIPVDLTSKDVPGKLAAQVLDRARITTYYNTFPFDSRKPFDPSGIRLGTPAVTTRGMTESEMKPIARWIDEGVEAAKREDKATINRIAAEVSEFAAAFPIPAVLA